jgi:hypothetical protein
LCGFSAYLTTLMPPFLPNPNLYDNMNVKEWEVKACQIKPHQGECCCFKDRTAICRRTDAGLICGFNFDLYSFVYTYIYFF